MGVMNVWVYAFVAAPSFSLTMSYQILATLYIEEFCLLGTRVALRKCLVTFSFQLLATPAGTWVVASGVIKVHTNQMYR
jgi:hypothetical protein